MIDPELIQMCADPRLEVEIVQQFVSEMNAADHLAVIPTEGNQVILVPKPETVEQAIETTQEWVGKADVRVGLTLYPAGLGITEPTQIGYDLFDTCENLRLGTSLFGKVLRVVTEWQGEPVETAFEDAITAYRTGWFKGEQIFYVGDPELDAGSPERSPSETEVFVDEVTEGEAEPAPVEPPFSNEDPNSASIRVDLSGIGAQNQDSSNDLPVVTRSDR